MFGCRLAWKMDGISEQIRDIRDLGMHACKPLRIEPAYRDLSRVWSLVETNAPYRSMAGLDGYREYGGLSAIPWFREHWALDGHALVPGADELLNNQLFIAAARAVFGGGVVRPMTVLINLMGPIPPAPRISTPPASGAQSAPTFRSGYCW